MTTPENPEPQTDPTSTPPAPEAPEGAPQAPETGTAVDGASPEATASAAGADGEPEGGGDDLKDQREAAKYRRRLREAEGDLEAVRAERDALAGHLAVARVSVIGTALDALAAGVSDTDVVRRFDRRALADAFPDTGALFDDAGNIDASAVREQLEQLAQSRPYMFRDARSGVRTRPEPALGPSVLAGGSDPTRGSGSKLEEFGRALARPRRG